MKNKLTTFTAAFLALCVIVGLGYCVILRHKFPSVGIEKVHHVDDLKKLDIRNQYLMSAGETKYVTADTSYLEPNTYVLVVRPTGAFHQYRGSFSQDVEVLDIRAGSGKLEVGDKIQIFRAYGIQYGGGLTANGIEEGVIGYTLYENVMYPEYRYLVFVQASELNRYQTRQQYYSNKGYPSVINIDAENPRAATEFFNDCRDIDFFCTTDEAAEKVYQAQRELMAKYGV